MIRTRKKDQIGTKSPAQIEIKVEELTAVTEISFYSLSRTHSDENACFFSGCSRLILEIFYRFRMNHFHRILIQNNQKNIPH